MAEMSNCAYSPHFSNIRRPGAFSQNVVNKNTALRLSLHFFKFYLLRWKWLYIQTAKKIFLNPAFLLDIYIYI